MRILHTSDWHIGRQFHNVSLIDDQQFILDELIRIANEKTVDVIIVSGDIYDRSVPPAEAIRLLNHIVERIYHELKIPLIMSSGNHDGATRIGFASTPLSESGIHIIGELSEDIHPIILNDSHGEVAFYAVPYAEPVVVRDVLGVDVHSHEAAMKVITDRIKTDNGKDRRCVVMCHCFIDGSKSSDSERQLSSVGGVDKVPYKLFSDFNYTALGHLHAPQHQGLETIRYSGSILKYSFSEVTQKKSVTLVEMDASGDCVIEKVPLVAKRDMRIIEGTLENILEKAKTDPLADDYLLVRLLDTHALYEPMAKLRQYYPNVLQLEKPNLAIGGERHAFKKENLLKGEMPMFVDFFKQMTDAELTPEEESMIGGLLDEIHKGGE